MAAYDATSETRHVNYSAGNIRVQKFVATGKLALKRMASSREIRLRVVLDAVRPVYRDNCSSVSIVLGRNRDAIFEEPIPTVQPEILLRSAGPRSGGDWSVCRR